MTGIELLCRRLALGMDQADLAAALGAISGQTTRQITVSRWESDERAIPPGVQADMAVIETLADTLTARYIREATQAGPVKIQVPAREETFWADCPECKGLPLSLAQVAAGRAWRELPGAQISET